MAIFVGVYSSPPAVNADGVNHILVTLNKANEAVAKASHGTPTGLSSASAASTASARPRYATFGIW
jgi:hypothetical protein